MANKKMIIQRLSESISVKQSLVDSPAFISQVDALAEGMIRVLQGGGKLVLCGNGGSASDALHFAGEIVGRFQREREAWPAVVLNADVATMTAISNDYGFDEMFSRQAKAMVTSQDMLIGISTSGNSKNVVLALRAAKEKGAKTAALLGGDGGKAGPLADYPVLVPGVVTARVQECHICVIHILCELVENALVRLSETDSVTDGENADKRQ